MKKNIFSSIKFIRKYKCFFCHCIKRVSKYSPTFFKRYRLERNYKLKKYIFRKIKYGSKNIFKKRFIMPSFSIIKKKYIYLFTKWLINFY